LEGPRREGRESESGSKVVRQAHPGQKLVNQRGGKETMVYARRGQEEIRGKPWVINLKGEWTRSKVA